MNHVTASLILVIIVSLMTFINNNLHSCDDVSNTETQNHGLKGSIWFTADELRPGGGGTRTMGSSPTKWGGGLSVTND